MSVPLGEAPLDCSPGSARSERTSVLLPSDDQAAQVSADCLVVNT